MTAPTNGGGGIIQVKQTVKTDTSTIQSKLSQMLLDYQYQLHQNLALVRLWCHIVGCVVYK